MGAPTFGSSYGNGGQNALYWNNLGSGGGAGGGGYGLDAQMSAMSNFDPATWINIQRQDARDLAQARLDRGEGQAARDRAYAEQQAQAARSRAAEERMRMERAQRQAATAAQMQQRTGLLSSVARAQEQHNSIMNQAHPFNPTGAVADYYDYGAGNPQGRGGGGSVGDQQYEKWAAVNKGGGLKGWT